MHGKRIGCEPTGFGELSTFECDYGFEFSAKKNKRTVNTYNGKLDDPLQCNRNILLNFSN